LRRRTEIVFSSRAFACRSASARRRVAPPSARVLLAISLLSLAAGGCSAVYRTRADAGTISAEIGSLQPEILSIGPVPTTWYRMIGGDTIWSIAQRFDVHESELLRLNPALGDLRSLPPGAMIRVPLKSIAVKPRPQPPPETVTPPVSSSAPVVRPVPAGFAFVWPVEGKVVLGFSQPLEGEAHSKSRGVEMAVQPSAEILATRAGVAYVVASMPGFGNVVVIDHGQGATSFCGYLSSFKVRDGQRVVQGQVIGLAAASNPARLHFRIAFGGRPVDPLQHLPPSS